jgi:eukaryotic-like serine/threonine-protein kinase
MFSPGSHLGPYEVLAPIGSGAMGEVYRARDSRLGRDVALKVLPSEHSSDPQRLRRFETEARAVASLNHPHILGVFDIGSGDGATWVAFELLEGRTLRVALAGGPLPPRKVVEYGVQICRGLAAAHEKGILHRDLKPENLFLTKDGQVKILDFGLAKLRVSDEKADSVKSRISTATEAGVVLGTTGYMSPEQARGQTADARSDVFALGAVLYEMLSGRRAFEGDTPADTLSAILHSDPPEIATATGPPPPGLERVVRRCLEKDPEERFHSARDVAFALEALSGSGPGTEPAAAGLRRRWLLAGAALVAAAAAGLIAVMVARWAPRSPDLPPPRLVSLTSMRGVEGWPAFSPDGEQVAFNWQGEKLDNWDVYLKMVGSPEIRRLTTDPAVESRPSWSPDGRQIAFLRGRFEGTALHPYGFATIHLVSPLGGPARKLSDFPAANSDPPSWSPDGRWLATTRAASPAEPEFEGVYLVPVQGGEPRRLALPKMAHGSYNPRFSPYGRHLAYKACPFIGACSLYVVGLDADYTPTGPPHRLTQPSILLDEGVGHAWTRDGKSLVYPLGLTGTLWRVGIAGDRPPERIELVAGLGVGYPATVTSRDRLAFGRGVGLEIDIYRFQTGRPIEPVVASSLAADNNPHFSPDGQRIAFESDRSGEGEIWLAEADGSNPVQLTHGPGQMQGTPRWSPDGQRIAFDSQGPDGHWDIWTIDADGLTPRRLTHDPGDENAPSWSRDGRFVYFFAAGNDGPDVWRVPAAGGPGERLTHGCLAQESLDGKTLFYKRRHEDSPLLARPLEGGPERQVLDCVLGGHSFAVGAAGIYHLGCAREARGIASEDSPARSRTELLLLDPATGRKWQLARLERVLSGMGLAASPDGTTILYVRGLLMPEGVDLMMIENFQ